MGEGRVESRYSKGRFSCGTAVSLGLTYIKHHVANTSGFEYRDVLKKKKTAALVLLLLKPVMTLKLKKHQKVRLAAAEPSKHMHAQTLAGDPRSGSHSVSP